MNGVLEPHLVLNHLRLDAERHHVRLEASFREHVFVRAILGENEHKMTPGILWGQDDNL